MTIWHTFSRAEYFNLAWSMLRQLEGYSETAYFDTATGNSLATIGVGFNLEDQNVSNAVTQLIYDNDNLSRFTDGIATGTTLEDLETQILATARGAYQSDSELDVALNTSLRQWAEYAVQQTTAYQNATELEQQAMLSDAEDAA
jgi:hypothetical protein